MTPIELFKEWEKEELDISKVRIPKACCLSSIGLDGFPNARFLELKGVVNDEFVVTGPLSSRKGLEIQHSNKVAITSWWTATEKQIRIQGIASKITDELADQFFYKRNVDSQIISNISKQGETTDNLDALLQKVDNLKSTKPANAVKRPQTWSGYSIKPIRIEFLEFSPNRFHIRTLFELIDGKWVKSTLQP